MDKYLKYKQKYLQLKQRGGGNQDDTLLDFITELKPTVLLNDISKQPAKLASMTPACFQCAIENFILDIVDDSELKTGLQQIMLLSTNEKKTRVNKLLNDLLETPQSKIEEITGGAPPQDDGDVDTIMEAYNYVVAKGSNIWAQITKIQKILSDDDLNETDTQTILTTSSTKAASLFMLCYVILSNSAVFIYKLKDILMYSIQNKSVGAFVDNLSMQAIYILIYTILYSYTALLFTSLFGLLKDSDTFLGDKSIQWLGNIAITTGLSMGITTLLGSALSKTADMARELDFESGNFSILDTIRMKKTTVLFSDTNLQRPLTVPSKSTVFISPGNALLSVIALWTSRTDRTRFATIEKQAVSGALNDNALFNFLLINHKVINRYFNSTSTLKQVLINAYTSRFNDLFNKLKEIIQNDSYKGIIEITENNNIYENLKFFIEKNE